MTFAARIKFFYFYLLLLISMSLPQSPAFVAKPTTVKPCRSLHMTKTRKDLEILLKVKRLSQMRAEGKNYSSYLSEMARYSSFGAESRLKVMKNVVDYEESNVGRVVAVRPNIVFLPDVGIANRDRSFYSELLVRIANVTVLDMPDIHEFNTKRYEVQWMSYMRNELQLAERDLVIAHGTSADALLRYLESDKVRSALLIDGSHIYTAGERHGRAYRYELMKRNIEKIGVVSTSEELDYDAKVLGSDLGIPNDCTLLSTTISVKERNLLPMHISSLARKLLDPLYLSMAVRCRGDGTEA